jgi:NAD(P)-dependent dehydrogenase (short-subunit alcohol dehydrogenase family)
MSADFFDLTGKVAVITGGGANGGIGHAIALGFAQAGAKIVAGDIDDEGAQTTLQEIEGLGGRAIAVQFDISQPESVEALFAATDQAFGQVDILVNVPFAFPERSRPHAESVQARPCLPRGVGQL